MYIVDSCIETCAVAEQIVSQPWVKSAAFSKPAALHYPHAFAWLCACSHCMPQVSSPPKQARLLLHCCRCYTAHALTPNALTKQVHAAPAFLITLRIQNPKVAIMHVLPTPMQTKTLTAAHHPTATGAPDPAETHARCDAVRSSHPSEAHTPVELCDSARRPHPPLCSSQSLALPSTRAPQRFCRPQTSPTRRMPPRTPSHNHHRKTCTMLQGCHRVQTGVSHRRAHHGAHCQCAVPPSSGQGCHQAH